MHVQRIVCAADPTLRGTSHEVHDNVYESRRFICCCVFTRARARAHLLSRSRNHFSFIFSCVNREQLNYNKLKLLFSSSSSFLEKHCVNGLFVRARKVLCTARCMQRLLWRMLPQTKYRPIRRWARRTRVNKRRTGWEKLINLFLVFYSQQQRQRRRHPDNKTSRKMKKYFARTNSLNLLLGRREAASIGGSGIELRARYCCARTHISPFNSKRWHFLCVLCALSALIQHYRVAQSGGTEKSIRIV